MCLFLNDLVFRVNKKKSFVDKLVDTPALEPRGFEPCQRCKRKKTYTHAHARVMRARMHTYIYIFLYTFIYIYIDTTAGAGFRVNNRVNILPEFC